MATQLPLRNKRRKRTWLLQRDAQAHNGDTSYISHPFLRDIMGSMGEREEAPRYLQSGYTEKENMNKNRRELLYLLRMAGMALAVPVPDLNWSRFEETSTRLLQVDGTVLHHLETINGSLWSVYLTTPIKSSVFESALGHFKMLLQLLQDPHPHTIHLRLCALTSEIGQLVGEVYFDLDDYESAQSCYTVAALCAKDAQSYDLWSCALVRSAFLPMYRAHYDEALVLLQSAAQLSRRGDSSLPTQYWVAAVEAEAQSGIRDLTACQRSLDWAQEVQDREQASLPWVRFMKIAFRSGSTTVYTW